MVAFQQGTIIAGRYKLERPLARGGMGSVWVARHLQLDVTIALKFMAPEYASSTEARARFEQEAKASAQLKSPNVVQVHDYGLEGDTPYLAMELLEGEDLEDRLDRAKRLSLADAANILNQACKALRLAHETGLVHRDLKPGNLFLAKHGDDEAVKILDFGIAKASTGVAGQSTKTGSLIGSPHYMSPEQVRNSKQVDHRSDLWSMGVIAFRMLTGRLPFPGEEVGEILVDICTAPIPVPSQIAPDLGGPVDAFVARALARDPAQRFQSARELAEAMSAVAGVAAPRMSLPSVSTSTPTSGPRAAKGTTLMSAVSDSALPGSATSPGSSASPASPGSARIHSIATSPGSSANPPLPSMATSPDGVFPSGVTPEGRPWPSSPAMTAAPASVPGSSLPSMAGMAGADMAGGPVSIAGAPYSAAAQSMSGPPSSAWGQPPSPSSGWAPQPPAGGWAPQTMMSAPPAPAPAPVQGDREGALAKIPMKAILLAATGALFLIILLLIASLSSGSRRRHRRYDRDRDRDSRDNSAATPRDTSGAGSFDGEQPAAAVPARSPSPPRTTNHDGCRSAGQACTCSNTGWSGRCGTGMAKSGLYCRCD